MKKISLKRPLSTPSKDQRALKFTKFTKTLENSAVHAAEYKNILADTERTFRTVRLIHAVCNISNSETNRELLKGVVNDIRKTIEDGISWTTTAETVSEKETTLLRVLAARPCLFGDRVSTESIQSLLALIFDPEHGVQTIAGAVDAASHHPGTVHSHRGLTALSVAANVGNCTMLKWLLFYGADPNVRNADGRTTLMHACSGGSTRVLLTLLDRDLDHRIDMDAQCNLGETALIKAVRYRFPEIIALLFNKRMYAIDPHLRAHSGLSAVDHSTALNDPLISSYITSGLQSIQRTRATFRSCISLQLLPFLLPELVTLLCDYCFRNF